jgi:hypothetical protein
LKEYFYSQTDLMRQILPSFFSEEDEPGIADSGPLILHDEELIAALNRI